MVSAKRIESFTGFILRQCIESLTMVSAKRIESFDFATMYRVFNNGFS